MDNQKCSALYTEKLIRLTKERLLILLTNPEAGKSTIHKDTRVAAMGNFSIFYSITDKHLIVKSFWDNRQNPDDLLRILTE